MRVSAIVAALTVALTGCGEPASSIVDSATTQPTQAVAEVNWLTDLHQARRLASETNQDLFVVFTGSAWCFGCVVLEKTVMSKPEFQQLESQFVFCRLVYPASTDEFPSDLKQDYIAWQKEYGVRSFPTVFLADASGKPYAVTGHIGLEVAHYVEHVRKLKRSRRVRDEALRLAESTSGVQRALNLDRALTAVRSACDIDFDSTNGNPIVRFYLPQIEEILSLDETNHLGLRAKYQDVIGDQTEEDRTDAIYAAVNAIKTEQGYDAAIEFLGQQIELTASVDLRNTLRSSLLRHLSNADRHEEALQYGRQLARDDCYSPEERRSFRTSVAHELIQLNRLPEGIAELDKMISELGSESEEAAHLYSMKAEYLLSRQPEQAIDVYDVILGSLGEGSYEWFDASVVRVVAMTHAQHFEEAVSNSDALLARNDLPADIRAAAYIRKARALLLDGQIRQALVVIRQVEEFVDTLGEGEQDTIDFVKSRVVRIRQEASSTTGGSSR